MDLGSQTILNHELPLSTLILVLRLWSTKEYHDPPHAKMDTSVRMSWCHGYGLFFGNGRS
ncbi:hypothetical protein DPMN_113744 [Dreissena polymorpha]|uniref:Uncharacterized protein n=1 Tax=Dreissena polymorpha TaxID=45954 RepID=A0A9D4KJ90_DREPO|nr:hypothetical protein DPMN_113744 [Dreissena polymorpha]